MGEASEALADLTPAQVQIIVDAIDIRRRGV